MDDVLQAAMAFAVRSHAGQVREGSRLPYVSHCFDVLKAAVGCGVLDDVTGPAALCHDVLEDCPGVTFDGLAAVIGDRAAAVVGDLSFLPDPADGRPAAARKAAHLATIGIRSLEAVVLKACDRYCNVTDFRLGRPHYAGVYLAKGDAIFAAVSARRVEIDQRWGVGCADRLLDLRRRCSGPDRQ